MRAPYPHVERPVVVPRPALIVSHVPVGPGRLLLWTMMITNAAREHWRDIGLLIPSKIRTAKIAAVEMNAATLLGRLDEQSWTAIQHILRDTLGLR